MGWRDAQAKVDAGAYKKPDDPFGSFATGFANVFVPTYTKIQEEKRAEERKKREEATKRAAAAAAAARAEDRKERERQEQTDFILMQLGFSDPSQASDSIRGQVYTGVRVMGGGAAAETLIKRYADGLPDSAYSAGQKPEPVVSPAETQTDEILTTDIEPGSVGTNVTTDPLDKMSRDAQAAAAPGSATEASTRQQLSAEKPAVTGTEAVEPVTAQTEEAFNIWGPQPRKINLNDFIGKDTTFIDDWVKINGGRYGADQLALLDSYREVQAQREDDALWWRDPQKLDNMSEDGLRIALNGIEEGSDEYQALNFALGIKTDGIKLDSLIGADVSNFDQFKTIYGEQIKEQGLTETFEELREVAVAKEADSEWWKDPQKVDNLSDNGLEFAIASAPVNSEERTALETAQTFRTKGLDLDTLRGKSVAEFDQYAEQYGDRLDAEGLRGTFDRMKSIQQSIEDENASEQVINAKDVFLRSRMAEDNYDTLDLTKQGQLMIQYEREWSEGTSKAGNETYTQANYDADFIKYTEIISQVGMGNGAQYSDTEIAEARRWMSVTKPIAEERLRSNTNASINAKIDMLVNQLGVEPDMAKKIALGVVDVRVDPVTREAFTYDISTGQRIGEVTPTGSLQGQVGSVIAPSEFDLNNLDDDQRVVLQSIPENQRQELFQKMDGFAQQLSEIDPTKPMGFTGAILRGFNRFGAVTGIGEISPDTATATGAIDMLAVLTETTLQSAFPETRDSVYLKTRLRSLAPTYGVAQNAEGALKTTNNMISFLNDSLGSLQKIANGEIAVAPNTQSEARVKVEEIKRLRSYYQALAGALKEETAAPSGANYLGTTIPEPPAEQTTKAPAQGTQENPYRITRTTNPASIPSGAFFIDPNGVLRQKQ
jgi:hypothetical protein